MKVFKASFTLPSVDLLVIVGLVFVVLMAVLVWYALRNKGDVRASLSLRPFRFTLDAKDRRDRLRN